MFTPTNLVTFLQLHNYSYKIQFKFSSHPEKNCLKNLTKFATKAAAAVKFFDQAPFLFVQTD